MNPLDQELETAVGEWRERGWPDPEVMLVTGSSLDVDLGPCSHGPLSMTEILPFPIRAVQGHALEARIVWPREDRAVVYFSGRLHCYQGFDPHQVVFAVRLGALLGAKVLILTNAAGSLSVENGPGTLCLISDHLNLSGLTPLQGSLPARWGPPFPSMSEAYDQRLMELSHACAEPLGLSLAAGTYVWMQGPSYETPAEVRMLQEMGGLLVGMSTVPEVLAARQLGVRCLALSLITNFAAGMTAAAPSHEAVSVEGRRIADKLGRLLAAILRQPALDGKTAACRERPEHEL